MSERELVSNYPYSVLGGTIWFPDLVGCLGFVQEYEKISEAAVRIFHAYQEKEQQAGREIPDIGSRILEYWPNARQEEFEIRGWS